MEKFCKDLKEHATKIITDEKKEHATKTISYEKKKK